MVQQIISNHNKEETNSPLIRIFRIRSNYWGPSWRLFKWSWQTRHIVMNVGGARSVVQHRPFRITISIPNDSNNIWLATDTFPKIYERKLADIWSHKTTLVPSNDTFANFIHVQPMRTSRTAPRIASSIEARKPVRELGREAHIFKNCSHVIFGFLWFFEMVK